MMYAKRAAVFSLLASVAQGSYPTECSAYSTCKGLQGDCCPNNQGVNLACCFSGALLNDAAAADAEAKKIGAAADKEAAEAKAAAADAQTEADKFKKQEDDAANEAKKIQAQIDDLNAHATAAQKKASQAAQQATQDATDAANQAASAQAAADNAKKVEAEQKKIVEKTSADAEKKKATAATAKANADKLNEVAGEATKKLNDAKKKAEEEAADAALKEKAEEKVVAAKDAEAKKIAEDAAKAMADATKKKTEAEAVLKKIDNAQCSKHVGCKGLEGYCCPTLDFNKMHLGSSELNGGTLGCCTAATELDAPPLPAPAPEVNMPVESSSGLQFGFVSLVVAFVAGSAVSAAGLKAFSRKAGSDAEYQTMRA